MTPPRQPRRAPGDTTPAANPSNPGAPPRAHDHPHAFASWNPRAREGLVLNGRRNFLKVGLAAPAGLALADVLAARAAAEPAFDPAKPLGKSLILLWMAGGPSHIDTWDPKPDQPLQNRGPFDSIPTAIPGVRVCEHLPRMARALDKFTIVRSVDARFSNHEPNKVFQTGNILAEPRLSPANDMYPALGSIVSKWRGPNKPGIPAYAAFQTGRSHIARGGWLGKAHDPFLANEAAALPVYTNVGVDTGKISNPALFRLPAGLSLERLENRRALLDDLDSLKRSLDHSPEIQALGKLERAAAEMIVGPALRQAFDVSKEPQAVVDRYGPHLWCRQALLARRLVEAGAAFVTIDLSYHAASGTWDNHGDNIPPYGGISKGLKPLLPIFDHLVATLVEDLDERGLLDSTLVLAMGEFGRTPLMGTQGSTDGRDHWPVVMSMAIAGGGLRHGRVIGSTERDGGHIKDHPVTPADLAATVLAHFGIPADATYVDGSGRPRFLVENGGRPIPGLF